MNPPNQEHVVRNDLQRLWHAVRRMRAAQKVEWDALPSNFRLWKRARQQQLVSQLEHEVDALGAELARTYGWQDESARRS